MKKYFLLLQILLITNAHSIQLHHYSQIKNAVANGKQVRFVTDFSKCTNDANQEHGPNFSSAYTPNEIIINNEADYIAASLMHFTLNHPASPGQPVYEFNRYILSNHDELTLSMITLNAGNYTPIAAQITWHCKIGDAVKVYTGFGKHHRRHLIPGN